MAHPTGELESDVSARFQPPPDAPVSWVRGHVRRGIVGIPWYNSWVVAPVTKIVAEFSESLKKYPPIELGTPDPYSPPR